MSAVETEDRRKFTLDKRLSVGDILQGCIIGFGGVWFIITMHVDISVMAANIATMSRDIADIKESLQHNVERLDGRIDGIEGEKKK